MNEKKRDCNGTAEGQWAVGRLCKPAVVGAVILFLSAQWLEAARVPVDYNVEVGFGGVIREQGGVFPVAVTINNKVAGTSGIIELFQPDISGKYEVTQVLRFNTPAHSIKRFVLLTRIEQNHELKLSVVFKEHIKTIKTTLQAKKSRKPLVLCLDVPAPYRLGTAATKYAFVKIAKRFIPSEPVALDGVHAVMLSGSAFAALGKDQVNALRQWTLTGGKLIFHEPLLKGKAFQMNVDSLTNGKNVNVWRRGFVRFGAGLIAGSGIDVLPNTVFWEGDATLAYILFPALAEEGEVGYVRSGYFRRLCRAAWTGGTGGVLWVVIIIAAYICVIWPLDRWLVKRLRRPYLTWVFFPVAIAAFSLLAYGYSRMVNIGMMRAVYVNVIDTATDCDVARGNSRFWVYSVKNATYEIGAPVKNVVFSARESGQGLGAVAGVNIVNGRNSIVSARIPIFSAKEFDATWFMPWSHQITCHSDGQRSRITVPEEIKVACAFIAGKNGMATLTESVGTGSEWIMSDQTVPWEKALRDRGKSLNVSYYGEYSDEAELMPSRQTLRNYLLCMSFPWKVSKDNSQSSYSAPPGSDLIAQRDHREKTLDIRDRIEGAGRVLLLFLQPSASLLPVKIKRYSPKTMQVNVVRLQIPEDV